MRKSYAYLLLAAAFVATISQPVAAQSDAWLSAPTVKKAPLAPRKAVTKNGRAYLGYCSYDELMWEYDGLAMSYDATVGAAIVLPGEMLKPYAGGRIVGMRVGWGASDQTGRYNGFVRNSFDGENLTTGSATVSYNYTSYGWNNLTLQAYTIPEDVDSLVVGFTASIKAGVYCIPKLYYFDTPGSCYLWVEGDTTADGRENWYDMHRDFGTLPILLMVRDVNGKFNNLAATTMLNHTEIAEAGKNSTAFLQLKNMGSTSINSIEVTTKHGETSHSETVSLSSSVAPGNVSGTISVPLYCTETGVDTFSVTKVNGGENGIKESRSVRLVGVPTDVAADYTRRPLVEYYECEDLDQSMTYYENYIKVGLTNYTDRMTLVCQHMDDQFMTGDDDATLLALSLADNDSSMVITPAMSVDRMAHVANPTFERTQADYVITNVLYPQAVTSLYNAHLAVPTFASVEGYGEMSDDASEITLNIAGQVAPGILPEGEKPHLTVYLMEKDVHSDSQMSLDADTKERVPVEYTHANVIRQIVTDGLYGDALEPDAEGYFEKTYSLEYDDTWDISNIYVVSIVNRGLEGNGKLSREVLNTHEGSIEPPTGIQTVAARPAAQATCYDLQGRRIARPQRGVSIVGGKKVIK